MYPAMTEEEAALYAERDRIGHHITEEYARLAEIRGLLADLRQDDQDG